MKTMVSKDGAQVFRFNYKWTDDATYNRGYKECDGYFIGTVEEFEQMRRDCESGFGFSCWDVEKVTPTAEDLREYEYWK